MNFTLECEQEDSGRWLAEVLELPAALAYGGTRDEAVAKAEAGVDPNADRARGFHTTEGGLTLVTPEMLG